LAMEHSWSETTIGSEILLQRGFDITKAEQHHGSVPVVSSGGVSSYHDTAMVKGPGVVLGRKGTLGTVFYIDQDYWPHDTTLWVKDFKGNLPRFVYYFFKSMSSELLALDNATANPALNRNHVHPIRVLWPSVPAQKAIVDLLGALDDKIELSRRINRDIEALASGLFKSWFVDFSPVTAKRDGKMPAGVPGDAVDLFPSHFEDSALGPIPRAWHIARLGDLAKSNARTLSPKNVPPEIRYVEISDVHRGNVDNITVYARGSEPSRARRIVRDGDTVISAVRPERGAYFLCLEPPPNLIVSTGFVVLTPRADDWALVYCAATSDDALDHYELHAEGGAYPAMRPEAVNNLPLAMPPRDAICKSFCSIVSPLLKYTDANRNEARKLAEVRDALLTPLLSGEITLKTAEKTVAKVV